MVEGPEVGGDLTSDPAPHGAIVGTWLATVTEGVDPAAPSFAMLLTFAPGGVLIESDQRQVGEVGRRLTSQVDMAPGRRSAKADFALSSRSLAAGRSSVSSQ